MRRTVMRARLGVVTLYVGALYGSAALHAQTAAPAASASVTPAGNRSLTGTVSPALVEEGCVTAVGCSALASNTTGCSNTALGRVALITNTTGSENTATGDSALYYNTTGGRNTATGFVALRDNTTGGNNTGVGYAALYSNTTG